MDSTFNLEAHIQTGIPEEFGKRLLRKERRMWPEDIEDQVENVSKRLEMAEVKGDRVLRGCYKSQLTVIV